MSLATIRPRPAMNRAGHIRDQDRTAAVVAHTRAEAAAVDRHPMAGEVHRPTVAEATANHTQARARAPAPITVREEARTLLLKIARRNKMSDGQPTVALSAFKDETDRFTRRPYRCR